MTTILIVEDELRERMALLQTVRAGLGDEVSIVGTASDSDEAYRIATREQPDIILLDIVIPGEGGLKVAGQLRDDGWDGEIVILTAHQSFDYARWALELRVLRYLLKPVESDALLGILRQAAAALQHRTLIRSDEAGTVDRLNERFAGIAEREFVRDILLHPAPSETLYSRYRTILELEPVRGVCFVIFGANESTIQGDSVFRALRRRAWSESGALVSCTLGDSVAFVVFSEEDANVLTAHAHKGATAGAGFLKRLGNKACTYRVGEPFRDMQSLRESFTACLRHVTRSSTDPFTSTQDEPRPEGVRDSAGPEGVQTQISGDGFSPQYGQEVKLCASVIAGDEKSAVEAMTGVIEGWYFSAPDSRLRAQFGNVRVYLLTVLRMIENKIFEDFPQAVSLVEYEPIERLEAHATINEALDSSVQTVLRILQGLLGLAETPSQRSVRRAKSYIKAHYFEPIALASVASDIGVSAPYLSALFRSVENTTFREYLTRVRVERARQLLIGGGCTLDEIARRVGYREGSALHKSFKRVTGYGPAGRGDNVPGA